MLRAVMGGNGGVALASPLSGFPFTLDIILSRAYPVIVPLF